MDETERSKLKEALAVVQLKLGNVVGDYGALQAQLGELQHALEGDDPPSTDVLKATREMLEDVPVRVRPTMRGGDNPAVGPPTEPAELAELRNELIKFLERGAEPRG